MGLSRLKMALKCRHNVHSSAAENLIIFLVAFSLSAVVNFYHVGMVYADEGPHGVFAATTDQCAGCHRTHTSPGADLVNTELGANAFCNTCHNGTGASAPESKVTHTNVHSNLRAEKPFTIQCVQCHDPHGSANRELIRRAIYVQPGPEPEITTGPIVFLSESGLDSYDDGVSPPVSRLCVSCHIDLDNYGYPMSMHVGGDGHYGNYDFTGYDCTTCHSHDDGFMPALNVELALFARVDLAVSTLVKTNTIIAGSPVTYTISVINDGPQVATNIVLSSEIPVGTDFATITPSQGTCTSLAGEMTCELTAIEMGSEALITVVLDTVPAIRGALAGSVNAIAQETDLFPDNNASRFDLLFAGSSRPIFAVQHNFTTIQRRREANLHA